MPLIINELPKREDKVITMGKGPVADYYPPGATEPQVRPAHIPADAPTADVEEKPIEEAATTPPVETVKEEKAAPKKVAKKK